MAIAPLKRERTKLLGSDNSPSTPSRSQAMDQSLLVVAIDFGTTYSGYAFSFRHEKQQIYLNQWGRAGEVGQQKTPTCLLLDSNRQLHSFGFEAKAKYETLSQLNQHRNWYFFWNFKMSLHTRREIRGSYGIREEGGKLLHAQTVFRLSIKWMKDHLMGIIRNYNAGLRDEEIRWVITVPAIWKDSAKKFMRKAATEAGIRSENLDIALEPEAASLYCQTLSVTRGQQTQGRFTTFPMGTKYMLLDCGGGTVDVTVHELLKDGKLKELHAASGGYWGGSKVNESFLKFIREIVGDDTFRDFSEEQKGEFLSFIAEIESKKTMTRPGSNDPVLIKIPAVLNDAVKDGIKAPKFCKQLEIIGDKLKLDGKYFESFFKEATSKIVSHVRELLEFTPGPIKSIIAVGGFSDSPVLQKCIRDNFQHSYEIIIPPDASLCVMKGAVLHGHDPDKVASRKIPLTYGVAMTKPFRNIVHRQTKKITLDGQILCDDLFDKHIEVGQTVTTGEVQKSRIYYPLSDTDTVLPVMLYSSSYKNPMYIDDPGCHCVGTFLVKSNPNLGKSANDRPLQISISFGRTDIVVEAKEKDGSTHRADFRLGK